MKNKTIALVSLSILLSGWFVLAYASAIHAIESSSKTVTLRIEGMT